MGLDKETEEWVRGNIELRAKRRRDAVNVLDVGGFLSDDGVSRLLRGIEDRRLEELQHEGLS